MILPSLPGQSSASFIGVVIAIIGNLLISGALNVQKLAHQRHAESRSQAASSASSQQGDEPDRGRDREAEGDQEADVFTASAATTADANERTALLVVSPALTKARSYTSTRKVKAVPVTLQRGDSAASAQSKQSAVDNGHADSDDEGEDNESRPYLRSKLWWLGLLLLVCGEAGNFASYGFAPASVVAPLGSFALIANCFLAPWLLRERFRWKDLQGVALCILGAAIVVISSNESDIQLYPDELLEAIGRLAFIVYASISLGFILILAFLSRRSIGERVILVDLGVCALTGGFTVLCAKALASFFQLLLFDTFKYWVTYVVIALLAFTAIVQVNFLNKALQRFDSRVVVPGQFVCFTVSAIVGSAVLYREFENTTFSKALNFLFGCTIVFGGVYILTLPDSSSTSSSSSSSTTTSSDDTRHRPARLALDPSVLTAAQQDASTTSSSLPVSTPRIRRSPSGSVVHSAPRTLSASAGYLLIASPRGDDATTSWGRRTGSPPVKSGKKTPIDEERGEET